MTPADFLASNGYWCLRLGDICSVASVGGECRGFFCVRVLHVKLLRNWVKFMQVNIYFSKCRSTAWLGSPDIPQLGNFFQSSDRVVDKFCA